MLTTAFLQASAADWPQWRGPERNGISRETGLLQEWPKEGPKLKWTASEIGAGYAAPSVVGTRVYVLANEGLDDEHVLALDASTGKTVWRTKLGKVGNPKQNPNFPAARSTPTVVGEVLYALGSDGDLACVETGSGKIRWQKSLRTDFGGKPGEWAYSESPLVDGDAVVVTPGGSEVGMVALNRKSGDVIWKCAAADAGEAAYASAVVVEISGVRQYVQLMQKGLVGVAAENGALLWRYAKPTSAYNANIPSPTVSDGCVYVGSAGTGGGVVKLKKTATGAIEPEPLYFESKLPTAIGGTVKVGDALFGTTAQSLMCVDFATGALKWQDRAAGAAAICFADNRLYLHAENGEVLLVTASPESYQEKGRFAPPDAPKRKNNMEKAWAYPVVANGTLYLREHGKIWCYDIKAGAVP
jgi:outer membrane protein assembly factor BamB